MTSRRRAQKLARRTTLRALRFVGLERHARTRVSRYRVARLTARPESDDETRRWAATREQVRTALADGGPVVVGPWVSEVGFEVLYWVPFLRFLVERFEIDPARLQVVSRGGTASWYEGIASRYVDIFDFMEPSQFQAHMEAKWQATGGQKQMDFDRWDRKVVRLAGDRIEWDNRAVLHPSLMYELFRNFWRNAAPMRHVLAHTRFQRLTPPDLGEYADRLPEESYVAVKFYFRPSFPDLPMNRRAVRDIVANLAARGPVVLLNTGLSVDDHSDVDPGVEGNVTWLLDGVPPNLNLHVQSLAIARATGFVGTYGGLSYLAPMYGIRSVAHYSEREHFLLSHLAFARQAALQTGGSLMTVSTRQSGVFELLGRAPKGRLG